MSSAMRAMRERQMRHLVSGDLTPSSAPGASSMWSISSRGCRSPTAPGMRRCGQPTSGEAMHALADVGLLANDDYVRLRKAYTCLCDG